MFIHLFIPNRFGKKETFCFDSLAQCMDFFLNIRITIHPIDCSKHMKKNSSKVLHYFKMSYFILIFKSLEKQKLFLNTETEATSRTFLCASVNNRTSCVKA